MQHIPVDTIRNTNSIQTSGPQRVSQPVNVMRKIVPKMTIGDGDSQVFSIKFDDEDKYLACGYGDGMTRIYNTHTGKLAYTLQNLYSQDEMPVTCLMWRPVSAALKTTNILVTGSADGMLRHWHATSGKCLHQKHEAEDQHIYAMDFSPDGTLLATAGKDAKVRVYDETTKSIAYTMKSLAELPGHSNRVFCVKFNPTDPNMLLSGGWDNTIQIYDQRYRGPVRTLYGPHVCGETIDIRRDGYSIVTGSYRVEEAIEVFDLRMNKRSRVIPWDGTGSQEVLMYDDEGDMTGQETDNEEAKSVFTQRDQNMASDSMSQTTTTTKTQRALKVDKSDSCPYIYTLFLNKNQDLLFAGGAGRNEMRVFDWESGNIVGMVSNLPKAVMSGGAANNSNMFAFGSADSKVRLFDIQAANRNN